MANRTPEELVGIIGRIVRIQTAHQNEWCDCERSGFLGSAYLSMEAIETLLAGAESGNLRMFLEVNCDGLAD